jgi:hypothetical protein
MPSPASRSVHLLIQGTQFLEPITSEPVELPRSIQPGQEVDVPGVLRAYIRNEWSEKPIGTDLNYTENIQLLATFHERLNRPIPNFCHFTQVKIRYPLKLDPPTYLDCVAKGDKVRFKWVVSGFLSAYQMVMSLTDTNNHLSSTTNPRNRTASEEPLEEQPRLSCLILIVSSPLHTLPKTNQMRPPMSFLRLSLTAWSPLTKTSAWMRGP